MFVERPLPPPDDWEQQRYKPWELDAALYDLAGAPDRYVSMNRFKKARKVEKLCELATLFVELDFYNVSRLAELAPEAVYELARERLQCAGIPEPNLPVCSGRGLQLEWLLRPVSPKELGRWNACQRRLYDLLKDLGADPAAKHAATILRLVGTVNSKNGGPVYALSDADPRRRSFDELARQLIPAREEPPPKKPKEPPRKADLHHIGVRRALHSGQKPPAGFTWRSYWEGVYRDLHTLWWLRYAREQMDDFRDRWLFIALTATSWIIDEPVLPEGDVYALAEKAGGWDSGWTRGKMRAVFDRVEMLARGETVMYEGFEWDPRYHFKNETIIEWLEITPEEEREMQVLIGEDEKRRRNTERRREKRRAAGAQPRAESFHKRRRTALELLKAGLSLVHDQATFCGTERCS